MRNYVYLKDSIVVSTVQTSKEMPSDYMELDYNTFKDVRLGMKWNGSTFEEVPKEELEENVEVTNQDLLDVLLEIGEKVGI